MIFYDAAIEILELLASSQAQYEYSETVPSADVPQEMICMWFDDFYHLTPPFVADFHKDQLLALASFNDFFEQRLAKIPHSTITIDGLQQNRYWREVSDKAKVTLEILKKNRS